MTDLSQPLPAGCVQECPGCRHRSWSYASSCSQKKNWLEKQLAPWQAQLLEIEQAPLQDQWGYRDKTLLHCELVNQHWAFGLKRWDEIIPIPDCPVHSARIRKTVALLQSSLPVDPSLSLAFLVQSGAQCVLVLKQSVLPTLQWLDNGFKAKLAAIGIEGFWIHLHPSAGKKVFTKRGWHLLWGKEHSCDRNGLRYGPAAFQQLIPALATRALDQAEAYLDPNLEHKVVDLYSGTGSSLNRWVAKGSRCLGVESGDNAIVCATSNVPKASLLRGQCEQRLPQIRHWCDKVDGQPLLYLNPPRTGLEQGITQWILAEYQPLRIAYLSCSAGTLSRDLNDLESAYEVVSITPYDFFPQTHHVETLVLLRLRTAASC